MKGCAEDNPVLHDEFKPVPGGSGATSGSAVTSSLRRARFYTFTETQKKFVSAEQEYALTRLVKVNDLVAKQQMIVRNLRMVVDIARRYADQGLEFVDLVREGNQGLIRALETFEPEGNLCFSAFADMCICQSIERAILDQYIPVSAFKSAHAESLSFCSSANPS